MTRDELLGALEIEKALQATLWAEAKAGVHRSIEDAIEAHKITVARVQALEIALAAYDEAAEQARAIREGQAE